MSLNYLSFVTLPLPKMGRDFLLAQNDKSIYRYFSLCTDESITLKSTQVRSYLFVFLGQISTRSDLDEEDAELIGSGEILKLVNNSDPITITARVDSVIYHVDFSALEKLVSWSVVSKLMEGDESAARRLSTLMNFSSLDTLPVDSAFELSQRMIEVPAEEGKDVVKQGELADSFYVITEGTADVWQSNPGDDDPRLVAKLTAGDSFGEDALITEGTRNATVRMTSDGRLFICKREDFQELVAHRSIDEIASNEALKLLAGDGYNLIDVRYKDEYDEGYIENATLIPLSNLRSRLSQFNKNESYILYCSSGKRSAVGAMILSRAGINAVSLQDGIASWPNEAIRK